MRRRKWRTSSRRGCRRHRTEVRWEDTIKAVWVQQWFITACALVGECSELNIVLVLERFWLHHYNIASVLGLLLSSRWCIELDRIAYRNYDFRVIDVLDRPFALDIVELSNSEKRKPGESRGFCHSPNQILRKVRRYLAWFGNSEWQFIIAESTRRIKKKTHCPTPSQSFPKPIEVFYIKCLSPLETVDYDKAHQKPHITQLTSTYLENNYGPAYRLPKRYSSRKCRDNPAVPTTPRRGLNKCYLPAVDPPGNA